MLKAGIFLDIENLTRNGGWGMRFDVIKKLAEAQGTVVLRANAYIAVDTRLERKDDEYKKKTRAFRDAIRRNGFHLIFKEVKRFVDSEGQVVLKANADLDLAVDALLQAENLDYVLLGSGDGDFLRLVRALQSKGKRVDVLAFDNTSAELRQEADFFFSGPLVPGLLPADNGDPERKRGMIHHIVEDKGYAFLMIQTGLGLNDVMYNVFCHITEVTENGEPIDGASFRRLYERKAILEFDLTEQADGRFQATDVREWVWT
ncbi:MAG: NYN domain-containing protein [Desulfobacteraceae bacterium]|jgi:uncharacterized LabA/DUF88 family protein